MKKLASIALIILWIGVLALLYWQEEYFLATHKNIKDLAIYALISFGIIVWAWLSWVDAYYFADYRKKVGDVRFFSEIVLEIIIFFVIVYLATPK